jgi:DNA primase
MGGSTGSPPSFLATLAVFSGSWSPEMAAKIPDGSEVVLALDNDKTGERYAREILGTLGPGVGVSDWKGEEGEDRRDALRRWLDASGPTS